MTKWGIMEGRLVPPEDGRFQCFPRSQWESEFTHAAKIPFDYIEWVYDLYGHDVNPLGNPAGTGIERLKNLVASTGVCIRSVCADYFMDKPLVRCSPRELDERLQELARILRNGRAVGVNRVVIPSWMPRPFVRMKTLLRCKTLSRPPCHLPKRPESKFIWKLR